MPLASHNSGEAAVKSQNAPWGQPMSRRRCHTTATQTISRSHLSTTCAAKKSGNGFLGDRGYVMSLQSDRQNWWNCNYLQIICNLQTIKSPSTPAWTGSMRFIRFHCSACSSSFFEERLWGFLLTQIPHQKKCSNKSEILQITKDLEKACMCPPSS